MFHRDDVPAQRRERKKDVKDVSAILVLRVYGAICDVTAACSCRDTVLVAWQRVSDLIPEPTPAPPSFLSRLGVQREEANKNVTIYGPFYT